MNLPLSEVDRQRGSVEKEQDPKVQRNSCRGFKKLLKFIIVLSLFVQFLFVLLLVCIFVPVSAVILCFVACLLFVCLFEQFLFVLCLQSSLFRKISRGLPSHGGESWRSWWEVSRLRSLKGGQPCYVFVFVLLLFGCCHFIKAREPERRSKLFFLCCLIFIMFWCCC